MEVVIVYLFIIFLSITLNLSAFFITKNKHKDIDKILYSDEPFELGEYSGKVANSTEDTVNKKSNKSEKQDVNMYKEDEDIDKVDVDKITQEYMRSVRYGEEES